MSPKQEMYEYLTELVFSYGFTDVKRKDSDLFSLTPYSFIKGKHYIRVGRFVVVVDGLDTPRDIKELSLTTYTDDNHDNQLVNYNDVIPGCIVERFKDGLHEIVTGRERIF